MTVQHNLKLALVASLFLVSINPSPASAEGYPGMGDRLKYAEALPHYNLGNRYLNKQWYEKAVESYRNAIEIYPFDADVYTNLGLALRKMNDFPRAEWAFKRSIELKGDDWTSISNLANTLMIQDKFSESLTYFQKALKMKDLPKEEKKAILYNIDGIKRIMKNKGLLPRKTASKVKSSRKKKISKNHGKPQAAKASSDEASYESWLGN